MMMGMMMSTTPTPAGESQANTNSPQQSSVARVPTDKAARYMGQLCKHFAHKIPATFDADSGRIEFSIGVCELAVAKDALVLHVTAAGVEDDSLARVLAGIDPALRFKPATRYENACASGSAALYAALDRIAAGRARIALVIGRDATEIEGIWTLMGSDETRKRVMGFLGS